MSNHWKFFFAVEAVLVVWFLYQLSTNVFVALLTIAGIWILIRSHQSKKENKTPSYLLGVFLLLFSAVSTSAFWFILLAAVFFISIKGQGVLKGMNTNVFKRAPWNEKEIKIVETTESTPKSGKRIKQRWVGTEKIGNTIFEWDDINFTLLMGDTIIDLGNTVLPKSESYIVIRKGIGKTRVLVPKGVGVMIEHNSLMGNVLFEGEDYSLTNESLKIYSKDYDVSNRKLKVITSVLVGDLEVITI